ncbi:DUF5020 family protein [bacterium]|nr:DUF5020 family protein [bacterium]MBU1633838.1 DUF5020 family protein [bacterium]MBU1872925.1 DUF5020 family protein [bacterium]
MKKILLPLLILLSLGLFGQNLQLHYDFGENRQHYTSTLEMFKPDDFGATFWFVDIDYCDGVSANSASMAYWEIARYIALPFLKNSGPLSKLTATVQYNDGLNTFGSFGNVWLGGISYPIDLKIVTVSTDVLFRRAENQAASYQLTLVWFKPFFDGKLIFSGFCDLWGQTNADDATDRQMVLLTEPQLWFNVSKNLAVGSEIEISKNFVYGAGDELKINATLGLKWEF